MVNFSFKISPGGPFNETSFALFIFNLNPLYKNQHPGFGYKPFILPIISFAFLFHMIFVSFFSILCA